MSLIENALFGEVNKIEIAILRLKEFETEEGYYLAFSGGKDSQVIYELAKMSGIKFDAHFNLTSVDPPELVYFIRKNYPDVEIHKPEKTMWELIANNTMPPTRIARYCCKYLKERGGSGRVIITGIRWKESVKRAKRKMFEICMSDKTKFFVHPIIDWSTDEVWEFIWKHNLEYCKLYDKGYKRIGCIMCPISGKEGMLKDAERFPKYYKGYLKALGKMLLNREYKGKDTKWKTPQEVMKWWIYGSERPCTNPDQTVMFE